VVGHIEGRIGRRERIEELPVAWAGPLVLAVDRIVVHIDWRVHTVLVLRIVVRIAIVGRTVAFAE